MSAGWQDLDVAAGKRIWNEIFQPVNLGVNGLNIARGHPEGSGHLYKLSSLSFL